MPETDNRKFKVLGARWLGLEGLRVTYMFFNLLSLTQANTPSADDRIPVPSAAPLEAGRGSS